MRECVALYLYVDDTVAAVHTHVAAFYGNIGFAARRASPDDVVARFQSESLTVAEAVFYHRDISVREGVLFFVHLVYFIDGEREVFAALGAGK